MAASTVRTLLAHHLHHIAAAYSLSELASPAAFAGTHHVRCWVCIEVCVLDMLSAESDVLAAQRTCLRPATLSSSSRRRWLRCLLDRWALQCIASLANCKGAGCQCRPVGCILWRVGAVTEVQVVGRKSVTGNDSPA